MKQTTAKRWIPRWSELSVEVSIVDRECDHPVLLKGPYEHVIPGGIPLPPYTTENFPAVFVQPEWMALCLNCDGYFTEEEEVSE